MGYSYTPKQCAAEVTNLRKGINRTRAILHEDYGRMMFVVRGHGVRAQVDDADGLKYGLPKFAKRVTTAACRFKEVTELVNVKKVPNTGDNKRYLEWYHSTGRQLVNKLSSPVFSANMLPPAAPKMLPPASTEITKAR
jgi:hypothetical protein